jgi:outer membrane murein-binding lipoprotein Lpp
VISLRYHAVSIAAVFLALAVGVVLGASGVSDRVLAAVSSQRDDLGVQVTRLSAERDALAAQDRAADEFASRVGPAAVRGLLARQTVALVVAGADVQDRDGVTGLIEQAGGTVTAQVELTDAVGDPARADQLRELTSQLLPTGAQLPAASDTGSLVGGLLVLQG